MDAAAITVVGVMLGQSVYETEARERGKLGTLARRVCQSYRKWKSLRDV